MEEELLRQILQEIQSQSGTSWQDVLMLSIPALGGLIAGLLAASIGFYAVWHGGRSELKKISFERRLNLRRDRYMELQNALAEFIAGLDIMLEADRRYAATVFKGYENKADYLDIYNACKTRAEEIRSSGRLSESRLKIGDQEIGDLVFALSHDADHRYVEMLQIISEALDEFGNSGDIPRSETGYWPEEHDVQRTDMTRRTHEISEMIEERISLID